MSKFFKHCCVNLQVYAFFNFKEDKMIGIVMGSISDLPTMVKTKEILTHFGVAFEMKIVSAHRTPELLFEYGKNAVDRGIQVIIAAAGGAAHLPGMLASLTTLPVIGVPIQSQALNGIDSLLSIVQMPKGVPVATVAIGDHGAVNAGILAVEILSISDSSLRNQLIKYKYEMKAKVLNESDI